MSNFIQKIKSIREGNPYLIYLAEENETAFVVPAQVLNIDSYVLMKKVSTGDVAVMLGYDVHSTLGLNYLSESLGNSLSVDPEFLEMLKSSHAGPTLDLKDAHTGSSDEEKVLCIKRLVDIYEKKDKDSMSKYFVTPGHVRTYLGRKDGLEERVGHTELGLYIASIARFSPIVCMVTLRNVDTGKTMSVEESIKFAKEYGYEYLDDNEILKYYNRYGRKNSKNGIEGKNSLYDLNFSYEDYFKICYIREFELSIERLFREGKIRGSYHLSIGQELLGVALSKILGNSDKIFAGHRSHHIGLAIDEIDKYKLFAEIIGSSFGYNGGVAGPMHYSIKEANFWGANGIVSSFVPIAAGVALADKNNNSNAVTVAIIGDGAMGEGIVHESLNMISLMNIPILIICENNYYSQSTLLTEHSANPMLSFVVRNSYNIKSEVVVDGFDPEEIMKDLIQAYKYVKEERKPYFLEVKTFRFCGHSMSDTEQSYRDEDHDKLWVERDPVRLLAKHLNLSEESIMEIKQDATNFVDSVIRLTRSSNE